MQVLLLSTYELGRQPFGLASPAAWLRRAGFETQTVDTSRTPLRDEDISCAGLIAVHLQMHTATRLAVPLLNRVRYVNPSAGVCCYGLYAPLNADWLRKLGVQRILGGEFEEGLVALAREVRGARGASEASGASEARGALPRLVFIQPDRTGLPPLTEYASVQMPDGSRRVSGATEASRGCKHLCRHCPVVPVYHGQFRIVPVEVVLADIRAQVAAGAEHISFGDPDFLNGPTHASRIVERLATEFPGLTYDVTIKIEHLLRHQDLLPRLRDTGCLFVTSAVESIDDEVLTRLAKGHTRADFLRAVDLCRNSGLTLSPTFVPFTPWTTVEGYVELLQSIDMLELVDHVAPIQLAIRLLVTANSALLELPEIRGGVEPFDAVSLTWPWKHRDAAVDELQRRVIRIVGERSHGTRRETFAAIADEATRAAGSAPLTARLHSGVSPVPCLNEPWYCCAEPDPGMGI